MGGTRLERDAAGNLTLWLPDGFSASGLRFGPLFLADGVAEHLGIEDAGMVLLRIQNRTAAPMRARGTLLAAAQWSETAALLVARIDLCSVLRQRLYARLIGP